MADETLGSVVHLDQLRLPLERTSIRQRRREEADWCDHIAEELRNQGLRVEREYGTRYGRVDLAVLHPTLPLAVDFIEAKIYQPLAGVGQLLSYRLAVADYPPKLTLVVPPALHEHPSLAEVCESVGITLWRYQSPEQRERRERFYANNRLTARELRRQKAIVEARVSKQAKEERRWQQLVRSVRTAQEVAARRSREGNTLGADQSP